MRRENKLWILFKIELKLVQIGQIGKTVGKIKMDNNMDGLTNKIKVKRIPMDRLNQIII